MKRFILSVILSIGFLCIITTEYAEAKQQSSKAYAYNANGVDYQSAHYLYRAISAFTRAIRIDPMYAEAYYNRGNVYSYMGQFEKAVSDFTKAIQIDPHYRMAYYNRAITYYLNKKYDKAWDDVHKLHSLGVQLHPSFLRILGDDSSRIR